MRIAGAWTHVRRELEAAIDRLFEVAPEDSVEFDSLLQPDEIDRLGYLRNFPHLTCLMCAIDEVDRPAFAAGRGLEAGYAPGGARLALLPATCYKVYLEHEGRTLARPVCVACIARCFRHEDKPLDRYRGFNFTMKEIVCLGGPEDARAHVEAGAARIERLTPRAYEDSGLVAASGMANSAAIRNRLRNDPARRGHHHQWFKRTADYFVRQGILTDTAFLDR